MENNIVNVYGYIRVSTEGQVKQGYSLAEQRAEIEKYCSSKSYNLIGIFKDEGISGAKTNEDEMSIERDGLLDMLASLKENRIQYIVVLSTNRLWRSDLVKVLLHRELKKNNVDIKAIDRPNYSIYTQNPNEIFVNGMFELLDVYERLEIALKLKRGRLQKARGGGAPFGYECLRGGKKLYVRVLSMSDEVYEAFKRVMSGRKKPRVEQMIDGVSGFLFLDDRGKPMLAYQWEKKFQHIVEKYNKIYKVELPKITPHICGHTDCTNMEKSGIAVKTLQYLMGHSDISVTMNVYTHLKLSDAEDELEKLKVREKGRSTSGKFYFHLYFFYLPR